MRLWSIHPKYLDSKGLVACWREALGAQKALRTACGYFNHAQLERFKNHHACAINLISQFLLYIYAEAKCRGYKFNSKLIMRHGTEEKILVTEEQVKYEFSFLQRKLFRRNLRQHAINCDYFCNLDNREIILNPLFEKVPGKIESWEKTKGH